jgi:hypothetical protein
MVRELRTHGLTQVSQSEALCTIPTRRPWEQRRFSSCSLQGASMEMSRFPVALQRTP